jgi:osmotically-inducible protein OsmY
MDCRGKKQKHDNRHGPGQKKLYPIGRSKPEALIVMNAESGTEERSTDEQRDSNIARDAAAVIRAGLPISFEHINVKVLNGWATLEGRVEWQYQKDIAESRLRHLIGVRGVVNNIVLESKISPAEIKRKVEDELAKAAQLEASRVIRKVAKSP